MKTVNQTSGQKASLRFGALVVLAALMQLSAYLTTDGRDLSHIWMTVLTTIMVIVLYGIARYKNYNKGVIIFITVYLNIIGVGYTLLNFLINSNDLGDILVLFLVVIYSYHQAGFLISTNFLWGMMAVNVMATIWPSLFFQKLISDSEAAFVASGLYLIATTIIITLKNKQDSTHREVSYKLKLNSTQEQLTAKQTELSTTQTQLTTAQTQISTLQQQLTACHTQQLNDHTQLKAKDEEIATLKSTLTAKQAKLELYSQQLTEYQTLLSTYQQQRELDLTHIERLQKGILSKMVVSVEGPLTNDPKRLKRLENHSLLWVYTQDRGKIAIAYFGLPRQAREAGLVRGQYIKVAGPIMGVEVSDSHTLVVILAWEILFKDTSEIITIESKSLPLTQAQLPE